MQQRLCGQGEMVGDAESLLKGKSTSFICSHFPWVLAKGGRVNWRHMKKVWGWWPWGEN